MKYAITTLGCKVNQYESSAMSGIMKQNGYIPAADDEQADIYIINTCTVTENSDKKAKQTVNRIRRENAAATIVLTGCYPQAFPEKAAELDADIVLGAGERTKIAEKLSVFFVGNGRLCAVQPQNEVYEEIAAFADTDKTRAYIKIEDGCDRFCSYCIIPYARGRVRSRSLESIRTEISAQADAGHKEVILVGINLSCYGKEIGLTLADAIETACDVDGIERVRLSSLEPEMLTRDVIRRISRQPKLCPHFHLSLQSGCDETLKRMNRHYTTDEYAEIVSDLREYFPDCAITTDVMVGFCGETDEEFDKSLNFVSKIAFSRVHVFTYSIREGTAAAKRTDHIDERIKTERYKKMAELAERLRLEFLNTQLGKKQKVLVQKRNSQDFANGLTPNYSSVKIYGSNAHKHDMLTVEITGTEGDNLLGREIGTEG